MKLLFAALLLVPGFSWGQAPSGSVERGKKIYQEKWCHSCHGTVGQGGERGAGPKIAPSPFPYEAFAQQTRRPRANMPRYPVEVLSDQEMADIYAYVASIKAGPAAKDIPLLRD
jgi:mono/diheme cytochrome c family protein